MTVLIDFTDNRAVPSPPSETTGFPNARPWGLGRRDLAEPSAAAWSRPPPFSAPQFPAWEGERAVLSEAPSRSGTRGAVFLGHISAAGGAGTCIAPRKPVSAGAGHGLQGPSPGPGAALATETQGRPKLA